MEKPPSQNAIGRALGLSSAAMVKLKKQGMPVDSVESARAWRQKNISIAQRNPEPKPAPKPAPVPAPPPAPIEPPDSFSAIGMGTVTEPVNYGDYESVETHDEARTRREIAEANLAELKEAELKGLHVRKSTVDLAFFEAARGLRDGMTNCSRRLAAEVANLTTPGECEAVIAREHRHLLESFTRQLAQKVPPTTLEAGQ